MYLIIWQFRVAPEKRAEFARRYASDGDWARLFSRSVEWQGTELLAVEGDDQAFFTIDRWTTPGAWERFRTIHNRIAGPRPEVRRAHSFGTADRGRRRTLSAESGRPARCYIPASSFN